MNYITTTELRTRSSELVDLLLSGEDVILVHRSKIIGEIRPKKEDESKLFNANEFAKVVTEFNLPKLTQKQREKNYREAMEKKHGKHIS